LRPPRLLIFLGGFALACTGPTPPRTQQHQAEEVLGSSKVTLLNAGSAPRRELRFHFEVGHHETIQTAWLLSISDPDRVLDNRFMRLGMRKQLRITSVSEDQSARFEFEVSAAALSGKDAEGESSVNLNGFRAAGTLDSRGGVRALQASKDGRNVEHNLLFLFEDGLGDGALPEEPVGLGASWTLEQRSVVWEVTLRGMGLNNVVLEYKTDGAAKAPILAPAGEVTYGLGYEVPPASWHGFGSRQIDLSSIAPTRADLELDQHFDLQPPKPTDHRPIFDSRLASRCIASVE
jgi:hypothetical protein